MTEIQFELQALEDEIRKEIEQLEEEIREEKDFGVRDLERIRQLTLELSQEWFQDDC